MIRLPGRAQVRRAAPIRVDDRVVGERLEEDRLAIRRDDLADLLQRAVEVHVVQHTAHAHDIERARLERQVLSVHHGEGRAALEAQALRVLF